VGFKFGHFNWNGTQCIENKKLSCRRKAARCFVPLNVSLSHSR